MGTLDNIPALSYPEALQEVVEMLIRAERYMQICTEANEVEYRHKHAVLHSVKGALGVALNLRDIARGALPQE